MNDLFYVFLRTLVGSEGNQVHNQPPVLMRIHGAVFAVLMSYVKFAEQFKLIRQFRPEYVAITCKFCPPFCLIEYLQRGDDSPDLPVLTEDWRFAYAHMRQHLRIAHSCTAGWREGDHEQQHLDEMRRALGVSPLPCGLHNSNLSFIRNIQNHLMGNDQNHLMGNVLEEWSWLDFFNVRPSNVNIIRPPMSDVEEKISNICALFYKLRMLDHMVRCDKTIYNVIYSSQSGERNTHTWLMKLYETMQIISAPLFEGSVDGVLVSQLIFGPLVEIEVQRIARERMTDIELVFGLYYQWLLRGKAGLSLNDLGNWPLFEIAVGQYCRERFCTLYTSHTSALIQGVTWWQSLPAEEQFFWFHPVPESESGSE